MSARRSTDEGTQRPPLGARAGAAARATRLVPLLLAALLAVTLALAPRAEAYIYWAGGHGEPGTPEERSAIGRANLDGSGVKQDFVALPHQLARGGLAVGDTHLYWTNPDASGLVGDIGRAKLDGTGANQSFIADVEMDFSSRVAVDDEHVYWVSKRADADDFADDFGPPGFGSKPSSGAIGRANLDGTGVDENFIGGVSFPAGAVAVDDSHLYWTIDWPSGFLYDFSDLIGRANLDGTGVEENFIPQPVAAGVDDLAVDDTHVWWTWSGRSGGGIERAKLDGTSSEQLIGGEDFFPGGIAVSDTHVFWTFGYPIPTGVPIGRARLDGSRVKHDFVVLPQESGAGEMAVDELGPRPSGQFSFGTVKKNKKKGTAKLTVKVPGPGDLELAKTKKVKGMHKGADAAGKQKLPIKPRRKAKKRLAAKGKAKVKAVLTFTPDGGEPNTQSKKIKLIKRR